MQLNCKMGSKVKKKKNICLPSPIPGLTCQLKFELNYTYIVKIQETMLQSMASYPLIKFTTALLTWEIPFTTVRASAPDENETPYFA